MNFRVISRCPEQRHGLQNILGRIQRDVWFLICSLTLAVAPCSFKFLNVCRIPEHYVAQLAGGFSRVYRSSVAVGYQERKLARMVDMGMGHDYSIDVRRSDRDLDVLKDIRSLLHSAVDKYVLSAYFEQRTRACDLMCGSYKSDLHKDLRFCPVHEHFLRHSRKLHNYTNKLYYKSAWNTLNSQQNHNAKTFLKNVSTHY